MKKIYASSIDYKTLSNIITISFENFIFSKIEIRISMNNFKTGNSVEILFQQLQSRAGNACEFVCAVLYMTCRIHTDHVIH